MDECIQNQFAKHNIYMASSTFDHVVLCWRYCCAPCYSIKIICSELTLGCSWLFTSSFFFIFIFFHSFSWIYSNVCYLHAYIRCVCVVFCCCCCLVHLLAWNCSEEYLVTTEKLLKLKFSLNVWTNFYVIQRVDAIHCGIKWWIYGGVFCYISFSPRLHLLLAVFFSSFS